MTHNIHVIYNDFILFKAIHTSIMPKLTISKWDNCCAHTEVLTNLMRFTIHTFTNH